MKLKKISYLLVSALILSSVSSTTYASELNSRAIIGDSVIIDKDESNNNTTLPPSDNLENLDKRTGSITISLSDTVENNDKSNVKFGLSKVATIDGEYKVVEKYKSVNVDLNNIKTASDLELAANLFKKVATIDNTLITDKNGKCNIDNVDVGVYLIFATDIAKYENITPFLISIPTWNEADKSMSYDINVIPKHTKIIKKERSKIPATGYDDNSFIYLAVGSCLLVGSGVLFLSVRKKESK